MPIPFPLYAVQSILSAAKWPRKAGVFDRPEVSGDVAGHAWAMMVQMSVGIGAGRAYVACQLLTQFLPNRDWTTEKWDDMMAKLDPTNAVSKSPQVWPWDTIVAEDVRELFVGSVPWDDLMSSDTIPVAVTRCSQGLVYGLLREDDARHALEAERTQYAIVAREAVRYGVSIPTSLPWPDNDSFFRRLGQLVELYQSSNGPLPHPDASLLATAAVRQRNLSRYND